MNTFWLYTAGSKELSSDSDKHNKYVIFFFDINRESLWLLGKLHE